MDKILLNAIDQCKRSFTRWTKAVFPLQIPELQCKCLLLSDNLVSLWLLELFFASFSNMSFTFDFDFVYFSSSCHLSCFVTFLQSPHWEICRSTCQLSAAFLSRDYFGPQFDCFNSLLCSSTDVLKFPFKYILLGMEKQIPCWISSSLNLRQNFYLV